MKKKIFAGLSHAQFMRRHWQKKPMLARAALAPYSDAITREDLMALACREDVESRLVTRRGGKWRVENGPFTRRGLAKLPESGWTLLVQGVDQELWQAAGLVREFAFIPFARFDDVMVSYAAPGGGVGPHFDSYDVFLLQGFGVRRWRYGAQDDLDLKPGAPLRILRRFSPAHDAALQPGDMLYLPPHIAHDGVALDACTTYSIGFRAPAASELGVAFLDFLRDELDLPGRYADADLSAVRSPAAITAAMHRRYQRLLDGVRWDRNAMARFVGCWLSEPKPHVFFERPATPLAPGAFRRSVEKHGVRLDLRSQLLYDDRHLYVNGTAVPWPATSRDTLRRLADERALASMAARNASQEVAAILYNWYRDGYVHTGIA